MKKHTRIALAAVLVAGFAASVYASPYWTLYRMKTAIKDKDSDGLARRVDFPALRESMKSQFTALMDKQMKAVGEQMKANGASDAAVASWRSVLPMGMFGQMVDKLVTPDGVAAMLSGAAQPGSPGAQGNGVKTDGGKPLELALSYRGWNRAVFKVKDSEGEGFVFSRDGLWSWKLSGIDLGQLSQP